MARLHGVFCRGWNIAAFVCSIGAVVMTGSPTVTGNDLQQSLSIRIELGARWIRKHNSKHKIFVSNLTRVVVKVPVILAIEIRKVGNQHSKTGFAYEYWAPISVNTGMPPSLDVRDYLALGPNETKAITIDPTRLRWGRFEGALWPNREFYSCVSDGGYEVRATLEILPETAGSKDNDRTISSNVRRIVVEH